MNIGVDIDEVVAEYLDGFNAYLKEKKGLIRTKEDYAKDWATHLHEDPAVRKAIIDDWRASPDMDAIRVVADAPAILSDLAKQHNIVFITSRLPDMKQRTIAWLKKNFHFSFDVVFANNPYALAERENNTHSKAALCKEHGIGIMIEDGATFALECAQAGLPVILFDKPWNKRVQHQNVTRITSWKEVARVINDLSREKY